MEGVQEVAQRLTKGEWVALPTECTYEALTEVQSPQEWPHRLEQMLSPWKQHQGSQLSSVFSTMSCSSSTYQPQKRSESQAIVPHVVVRQDPSGSGGVRLCDYVRDLFPKRPYVRRSSVDGSILVAHAFDETRSVLQLVAAKYWPGPLLIHVAVPQPSPLTHTDRQGNSYLTLRCPCHPLAVKVCQEHYQKHKRQKQHQQQTSSAPGTLQTMPPLKLKEVLVSAPCATSPTSSPSRDREEKEDNYEQEEGSTNQQEQKHQALKKQRGPLESPPNTPPLTSKTLVDHPMNGTPLRTPTTIPLVLGMPLPFSDQHFVTHSSQVSTGPDAVLDGEDQREVFAVPPCELGETPWQNRASLWLQASTQTMTIRRRRRASHAAREEDNDESLILTAQGLREALKFKPKTAQQQIVLSVLHKWKIVVADEFEDDDDDDEEE